MIQDALIITNREVRDSLRDWRIVAPMLILTLIFPWILNLSTRLAMNFVEEYGAQIIPTRLIPFGMLIVGFFPISFSLIIALETFVGEKERNTLEPLLGAPISDTALYVGKLLAAMLLPLVASYLGIFSYLAWLSISMRYLPEPQVLIQIMALTTMEALVMVAGAVVMSSHTTSVRAANLLASFIIVPMAFLLQAESVLLFWGYYDALWFVIAGLVVVDVLLVRTGVRTFNREEILAREMDELQLGSLWRAFRTQLLGSDSFSLVRIYREDIPCVLARDRAAIVATVVVLLGALVIGGLIALRFPLPAGLIRSDQLAAANLATNASPIPVLPRVDTLEIFTHNVWVLAASAVLALFSFGSMALLLLFVPIAMVGLMGAEMALIGLDPIAFLLTFILPHGLFELPAAVLATAFALRLGASITAPPPGVSAGENLLRALADWIKVFLLVIVPLLLVAAWIEANVTPQVVVWFYGR